MRQVGPQGNHQAQVEEVVRALLEPLARKRRLEILSLISDR